ncbi:hypothetical protein DRO58_04935 [Candidatus Bathyarchaeota archaeon]|nr:MAG: hypothetical protein DRO58_04935 [Candidatus Bathyarchaeota archaeon]
MVEIIKADRGPLIHIHYIERVVHGNGIVIKVYGKMKIAAKEYVYAHELKLNTIEVLLLTPETGVHTGYLAQKWVYNPGEYGNYASVDIFNTDGTEITAGAGPVDGSIWLDFEALGE